jgi:hypothetical protein
MHNIDIMHQECNGVESIVMMCMNFTEKSKDNKQARKNLAMICHHPSLELSACDTKTQAPFCMKAIERKEVMTWMKNLKFLDGFVAGFRWAVNLKTGKLTALKSHDYHVIMEWLLLNMLWGYVHQDVWKTLAELSYFYIQLCAKEIKKEMMEKLEKVIPLLLCKLEKIFPPGWFNPMQHLLIHLSYEAKVGGPVQYRWMYPFERALKRLRHMVGNKAGVEGYTSQRNITSMHIRCGTMYIKMILTLTLAFFNQEP